MLHMHQYAWCSGLPGWHAGPGACMWMGPFLIPRSFGCRFCGKHSFAYVLNSSIAKRTYFQTPSITTAGLVNNLPTSVLRFTELHVIYQQRQCDNFWRLNDVNRFFLGMICVIWSIVPNLVIELLVGLFRRTCLRKWSLGILETGNNWTFPDRIGRPKCCLTTNITVRHNTAMQSRSIQDEIVLFFIQFQHRPSVDLVFQCLKTYTILAAATNWRLATMHHCYPRQQFPPLQWHPQQVILRPIAFASEEWPAGTLVTEKPRAHQDSGRSHRPSGRFT